MKFHYKELKDVKQGGFETRPYKDSLHCYAVRNLPSCIFSKLPGR
jgi:hypothetical protein